MARDRQKLSSIPWDFIELLRKDEQADFFKLCKYSLSQYQAFGKDFLFRCCIVGLQFWIEFCKTANDLLGVLNIVDDWTIKHFATLLMLIMSGLFKKMYLIFNHSS